MELKSMAFMALLLVAGAAIAQEQPNLGLIPTPQQVVVSDSNRQVNLHTTKVKEKLVATLPVERNAEQGYVLEITPKSITLKYSSDEGRQYGYMTLSQLRQLHTSVPSMSIRSISANIPTLLPPMPPRIAFPMSRLTCNSLPMPRRLCECHIMST